MKAIRLQSFKEDFDKLPDHIKQQTRDKFRLFMSDSNHPSLRIKKMKGHGEIWEGHISMQYVFTFMWATDEQTGEPVAVFRRIGSHDIYKKP